jgi:hypothetical protein
VLLQAATPSQMSLWRRLTIQPGDALRPAGFDDSPHVLPLLPTVLVHCANVSPFARNKTPGKLFAQILSIGVNNTREKRRITPKINFVGQLAGFFRRELYGKEIRLSDFP